MGARTAEDARNGEEPTRAYTAGRHSVGSFNFDPEVQGAYSFPRPLMIVDSTLRKIIYTTGIYPSADDLLYVAEALEQAGIREMVLNVHWWGEAMPDPREYELCHALLARDFAFRTTVVFDAAKPNPDRPNSVSVAQALDALQSVGVSSVAVSASDPGDASGRARQSERLAEVFTCARSAGVDVTISITDAPRLDFDYVAGLANEGIQQGATQVEISDSCSSLCPEAMKLFVTRLNPRLVRALPVIVHTHNDFGLASATAIAAASAGSHPDVAVNGVSYRSGFAVLEEVVLSLELLYGVSTGIRLDQLQRLSDVVVERTGLPNHPLKPITGAHAFLRDAPGPMRAVFKNGPDAFPPPGSCFAPSLVGSRMRVVWANFLPASLIAAKLEVMGLGATQEQVMEIRRRIEARLEALPGYPRWLSDEEVEAICRVVAK